MKSRRNDPLTHERRRRTRVGRLMPVTGHGQLGQREGWRGERDDRGAVRHLSAEVGDVSQRTRAEWPREREVSARGWIGAVHVVSLARGASRRGHVPSSRVHATSARVCRASTRVPAKATRGAANDARGIANGTPRMGNDAASRLKSTRGVSNASRGLPNANLPKKARRRPNEMTISPPRTDACGGAVHPNASTTIYEVIWPPTLGAARRQWLARAAPFNERWTATHIHPVLANTSTIDEYAKPRS